MHARQTFMTRTVLAVNGILIATAGLRAEVPAAPPGYTNEAEVKQAYMSGKLRVINLAIDVPDSVTIERNIEYGKGGTVPLKLDLYSPKNHAKSMTAVIFIHGGAWKGG